MASWVAYSLFSKVLLKRLSPILSVTHSAVVGSIIFGSLAIDEGVLKQCMSYSLSSWLSLIYLGVFGTACAVLWYNEGIQKLGPGVAGLCINFVPISAVVLSYFILDEPLTNSLLIGGGLVTFGVLLTRKHGKYGNVFIVRGPEKN